jgi:DNA-binding CsgD family transcriptional regulator
LKRLQNRLSEIGALEGLLEAADHGEGGGLVLRGEPGVGLTSLLEYAVGAAGTAGMRVTRVTCDEWEHQLGFAGVHQLCAPLLDNLRHLPVPQQQALSLAFGRVAGPPPEPFLVGLAALTLLSAASNVRPVLCAVDDAQWLDPASAAVLAFVARRLLTERVALLFAVQVSASGAGPLTGVRDVLVSGLAADDARKLLESAVPGTLDAHVADRLVAETGGNPLALLELPGELTPDQLGGAEQLPEPIPVGDRLVQRFLKQVRSLPADTQVLLLLSAADPEVDAGVFWSAAARLGLSADAAAPAERERLVTVNHRIAFRHPLIRSAIYAAAPKTERLRVHQALTDAIDSRLHPERHAWHRAVVAQTPDEDVAAGLARSGELARARGDNAAAATLLERASRLSPGPGDRFDRSVSAVEASLAAGTPGRAAAELAQVRAQKLDRIQQAQVLRLRGAISFALGQGADAAAMMLDAALALEDAEPRLARQVYLEALEASIYHGRFGNSGGSVGVAARAREAPRAIKPTAAELLLDGLSLLLTEGHAAAVPVLRRAIAGLRREDDVRWLPLGALAAIEIWDDEGLHGLANRHVQLAREAGQLSHLTTALHQLGGLDDVLSGRLHAAAAWFDEARDLAAAGGDPFASHADAGVLIVAAWQGRPETRDLAVAARRDAVARGLGRYVTFAQYATAVLEMGLGNYEAALAAALEVCEDRALYLATQVLPEVIEAAVRLGETELAAGAVSRLEERTVPSGTDWALGTLARSQALLAEGAEAESLYLSALERLRRSRSVPSLARTHLLYGEWLRRERRRRDARAQLRMAHGLFESIGAGAFDERARIELLATGERVAPRAIEQPIEELTAQEARIARLVSEGSTNPQIAQQLYISPRTVEYHLHKIFRKLDVTTRTQLAALVRESD